MPISFSSKSHGQIPIGFFNIETDMMLMERYFFFSTDFCEWVIEWADAGDIRHDERMVYVIQVYRNGRDARLAERTATRLRHQDDGPAGGRGALDFREGKGMDNLREIKGS